MKRKRRVDKLKVASAVVSLAIAGAIMFGVTSVIQNVKQNSYSKYNIVDLGESRQEPEGQKQPDEEESRKWEEYKNQVSQDGDSKEAPTEPVTVAQPQTQAPQEVVAPSAASARFSFGENDVLVWPVKGDVVLQYSMESTVFYKTLGLYKCNPSISIAAPVGTQVKAAASGVVKSVSENEETGLTVVMDIGNDYSLTYGQLADVSFEEGSVVMAGEVLGTVAKPTVYYTEEGANLYFAMQKAGESVDPSVFLTE